MLLTLAAALSLRSSGQKKNAPAPNAPDARTATSTAKPVSAVLTTSPAVAESEQVGDRVRVRESDAPTGIVAEGN